MMHIVHYALHSLLAAHFLNFQFNWLSCRRLNDQTNIHTLERHQLHGAVSLFRHVDQTSTRLKRSTKNHFRLFYSVCVVLQHEYWVCVLVPHLCASLSYITTCVNSYSAVTLTDVLLPVAGDLAVNLVSAIFTGDLSQSFSTLSLIRHTFPVLGLCSGALWSGPGLPTWWNRESQLL